MKKIAVMLPVGYQGGSLRAAKNLAKGLAFQAHQNKDDIQIVFSYSREGDYNIHIDFDDLTEAGIVLRETTWNVVYREQLRDAAKLVGIAESELDHQFYCLPSDGINDFFDCDLWLIISDRLRMEIDPVAPLFPLRRCAFIIYDYIQRYVPEIFGVGDAVWERQVSNLMHSVKHAARVFVTTPSTREDLISYVGVHPSRVQLLEMEFQPLEAGHAKLNTELPDDYVLWPTNTTAHKNHANAFDAIETYIQDMGGNLHFLITGTWTEYFDPTNTFPPDDPVTAAPHVRRVREKLKKDNVLAEHIHVMGNISDRQYATLLKHSRFLWHPTLYDNGTFAVMEAAYLGVPSLSARYPAMEYINDKFALNMRFFDPRNPKDMARALLKMETDAASITLPERDALLQRDWKTLSPPIYQSVLELLW